MADLHVGPTKTRFRRRSGKRCTTGSWTAGACAERNQAELCIPLDASVRQWNASVPKLERGALLLVPQCRDRVRPEGSARRQVTRDCRDRAEQEGDGKHRGDVAWLDLEQQAAEHPCERDR